MWLLSAQTLATVMGTEFLILVGLNSDSHVWLMAAMLSSSSNYQTTGHKQQRNVQKQG